MSCTPIHLFVDRLVWNNDRIFSLITNSYRNYTPGDAYDCALKSVPCDSKIMRAVSFPEEDYENFVYWFDLLVSYTATTIVTALGQFGNIASIIIFATNKIANDSTNFLLLAISVADLLSILLQASLLLVCYLCFIDVSAAISSYNIIAPLSFQNNRWLNLLSLDFVVLLAIQRAGAVFIPFRASVVFSYRNTKIAALVLGIIFLGTILPFWIYSSPMWVFHPYFNKFISLHHEYHLGFTYTSVLEYQLRYSSYRYIIDLCLTIFFVSVTVIKMKYQSKSRASLQATATTSTTTTTTTTMTTTTTATTTTDTKQKGGDHSNDSKSKSDMSAREQKVMRLSLTVCFVTFVIYSWHTIGMNLIMPRMSGMFQTPFVAVVFFSGRVFGIISCAFNFVLYVKMSTQYRHAFKKLFTSRA